MAMDGAGFFGIVSPFIQFCGFEAVSSDESGVVTRLEPRPELMNARGVVHGGVLTSFFDVSLGAAANLALDAEVPVATIDLTTSFLAPASGILICKARVLRQGKSIVFCEGEIFADHAICAKAMATYRTSSRRGGAHVSPGVFK